MVSQIELPSIVTWRKRKGAGSRLTRALPVSIGFFIGAAILPDIAECLPNLLTYQGRLTDSSGNPITQSRAVTFTFYSASTGGSPLAGFSDTDTVLPNMEGIFSTLIGDDGGPDPLIPDSIFQSEPLFLSIAIQGENTTPRLRLASVAFAFEANNADTLDGVEATALEESAEIDSDIAAHDSNASAHANIQLDGARITSGKVSNLRLNTGTGNGLDADTVDGMEASALDDSAEIDADVATHNTSPTAHANIQLDGARITSGKIDNARLNTGSGNGLDADTVDGMEATDFASAVHESQLDASDGSPTGVVNVENDATVNVTSPGVHILNDAGSERIGLTLNTLHADRFGKLTLYGSTGNPIVNLDGNSSDVGSGIGTLGNLNLNNESQVGVVSMFVLAGTGSGGGGRFRLRNGDSTDTIIANGGNGRIDCIDLVENSDASLKQNVNTLSNALAKVRQLRGVSYNWNEGGPDEGEHVGFIAQEVEKIFPEVVVESESGKKALSYGDLTAPLVEALKELSGIVERHELEIQELRRALAIKDVEN